MSRPVHIAIPESGPIGLLLTIEIFFILQRRAQNRWWSIDLSHRAACDESWRIVTDSLYRCSTRIIGESYWTYKSSRIYRISRNSSSTFVLSIDARETSSTDHLVEFDRSSAIKSAMPWHITFVFCENLFLALICIGFHPNSNETNWSHMIIIFPMIHLISFESQVFDNYSFLWNMRFSCIGHLAISVRGSQGRGSPSSFDDRNSIDSSGFGRL